MRLLLVPFMLSLSALQAACDPLMSIRGTVFRQRPNGAAEPLGHANVELVCPKFERYLTTTDADGTFDWIMIGFWNPICEIHVSTRDGKLVAVSRDVGELCKQTTGREDCMAIEDADFTLTPVSPVAP